MKNNRLRSPIQSEDVENNWAISYGDMITLLLGFFVIFFNIKTETVNLTLIKKDLDKYFQSAKGEQGRNVAEVKTPEPKLNTPILSNQLANAVKVNSNLEGERILVEFPDVSFFRSASHALTKDGKTALADFAKAINQHLGQFRLVVRGYTDGKPVTGASGYKDNLELSAFRSISAIRYLADQGVKLEQMRIAGYGESSMDRTEKDKKANGMQRKVVIVIEPLDQTERMHLNSEIKLPMDAKTIESIKSIEIPERQVASERPETTQILDLLSIETLERLSQEVTTSKLYERYVDYLVHRKLVEKGYSELEIEKLMETRRKAQ